MSELKVDKVSPRTGNYVALNTVGSKNIIINGDMSIAQRGTTATGIGNGSTGYHTVDRWKIFELGAPTCKFTMTQDTDVPSGQGFATSLKMDCTTAQTSLGTSDNLRVTTLFEGQNLQYLKYGTANAESLTLSFWVKSNKTGDYSVGLYNNDTVDVITNTITINSADTWEKKTITFTGDTSNAFDNDNGLSLYVWIHLLAGADYTTTSAPNWTSYSSSKLAYGQTVNLADNTSNYINITGVQLEAGTTASDFEFLPFDVNLDRCLRYYELVASGLNKTFANGHYYNSTYIRTAYTYRKIMRATPSLDIVSGTEYYRIVRNNSSDTFDDFTLATSTDKAGLLINTTDVSGTGGQAGDIKTDDASAYIAFDAEL